MTPNLTLHPLWHTFMPAYQHSVGTVTLAFSTLAFYLMIKKTPKASKPFANYLILLQVSQTMVDVNYDFLFCPISLYSLNGILCNGIICTRFMLNGHVANSMGFFSLSFAHLSVIYCFHYKHTSIASIVGSPKQPRDVIAFRIKTALIFFVPCILELARYRNVRSGHEYAKKNFPSLYYLFENPDFHAFAYDPKMNIIYGFIFRTLSMLALCFAAVIITYFVITSFSRLSKQSALSEKTRQLQQRTMTLLIVQTLPPLAVQTVPLLVYATSMLTVSLDPKSRCHKCVSLSATNSHLLPYGDSDTGNSKLSRSLHVFSEPEDINSIGVFSEILIICISFAGNHLSLLFCEFYVPYEYM